ncbi:MAG: hypothetical protein LQ352_007592 [Teloschistes flavicans]|nr:MAG: hypothetical protein LQ352_007592 [Teloschistes flavicans]
MAQPDLPANPAGCNKFIEALQGTAAVTCFFLASYPLGKTLRPLAKRLCSPVPNEIIARRNKKNHRIPGKPQPKAQAVNEPCTSYMDLPLELRTQILGEVLVTEAVWPYAGLTVHQRWQRDFEIATAAHRHAWTHFVRHPNADTFYHSFQADLIYLDLLIGLKTPILCTAALKTGPHVLSVCRSMLTEGLPLFYTRNTFHIIHGPLATARLYYDNLPADHRNRIQTLVLDITPMDLTVEIFDEIESRLRATHPKSQNDGRFHRLRRSMRPVPDNSSLWATEATTHLIAIWRSKLEWLREAWPSLGTLEIAFCLTAPHLRNAVMPSNRRRPYTSFKTCGGRALADFLRGIRGGEPSILTDEDDECYEHCDKAFARFMKGLEAEVGRWMESMLELYGWKCFKAWLRHHAYEGVASRQL